MAEVILLDTGPIVALLNRRDEHHSRCVDCWKGLRGELATVWPVLTEAAFLLSYAPGGVDALMAMVEREAFAVLDIERRDSQRMREFLGKYADLPMDLADAALVAIGEREGIETVFTLDVRGFGVFRPRHCDAFRVIP